MVKRSAIRSIAALACLQLFAAFAFGQQSGSIQGRVLDGDFVGVPLRDVIVEIVETRQRTTTSQQGNYSFGDVAPGEYSVSFSRSQFKRVVKFEVPVLAGQLTDLDAELFGTFTEMDPFVSEEVLLVGGATEAGLIEMRFEAPALMDSIGSDLLSKATAGDAADALKLVAGATVADDSTAVVRGLPDRYVSSQVNGVRLPSANEDKRAVELDQFPSAVIQSVQVSKTFTPDQQGDASGGAVNVVLKSIPDKPVFTFSAQRSYNTQAANEAGFLSYRGGGVGAFGQEADDRPIQQTGENWDGAVGVNPSNAPTDYKFSSAVGGSRELDSGVKIGGFFSLFYEKDSAFVADAKDDSYWVDQPGEGLIPQYDQASLTEEFITSLFDIQRSSQVVQWGGVASTGVEWDRHSIGLQYLYSHTAEDRAVLAEDTRGKEYFFPGYDPNDPAGPGNIAGEAEQARYLRTETLEYTERTTGTLQLNGRHEFEMGRFSIGESVTFKEPVFDWTVSSSFADLDQPDKRLFGQLFNPRSYDPGGFFPPSVSDEFWEAFKPAANFTLGNLQRIFKTIEEDSQQISINAKLPFDQWNNREGFVKVGLFDDRVDRSFDQESFSNFSQLSSETQFQGSFDDSWSAVWGDEDHPITQEFDLDVDYDGEFDINAWYTMLDMPVSERVKLIGGARFETTRIVTDIKPGADANYFAPFDPDDPSTTSPSEFTDEILQEIREPFTQDDVLPSIGLVYEIHDDWTLRAAFSRTVARPTFKELTPILQQEFLGGPVFIGNPNIRLASLDNYDLRLDYRPFEGSLVSLSYFLKEITDPIEYVQRNFDFSFTTPVNYPEGKLSGVEFEVRQTLGRFYEPLTGVSVGANATLIESDVTVPDEDVALFADLNVDITSRDATNAPDYLLNLFATYDIAETGTQFGLFYTVRGDTLVTGDSISDFNYVPSVYARTFDTLNFSINQRLTNALSLKFQAKNLTNPTIREVYRSDFTGPDLTNTSFTRGVEYAISLSANYSF